MGLDAVVFRNIRHLELGSDKESAQLIPETGQVFFEDDEVSGKYRDRVQAAHFRLGNIRAIAELREEVAKLMGPESLLCRKVLYSGSHSGDFVPRDELGTIDEEIASLQCKGKVSGELGNFLSAMKELIRVAVAEGNPIVIYLTWGLELRTLPFGCGEP